MPSWTSDAVSTGVDQVGTLRVRRQGQLVLARPVDRLRAAAPSTTSIADTLAASDRPRRAGPNSQSRSTALIEQARVEAVRRLERDSPTLSPTSRVDGMRRWDGHVLEVSAEFVVAELTLVDGDGPAVVADFPAHLFGSDQIAVGDGLYVTSREILGVGRRRNTTTSVRLRRLGKWTTDDLEMIEKRARERAQALAELIH